jgi:hypothetical protein
VFRHYETQDQEMFPAQGPARREFFSGATGKNEWFAWGFSVNLGISCPGLGVNQEKLPAKCLPFPVIIGWCLAGSFPQLPSKTSLSPMMANFPVLQAISHFFGLWKLVQIAGNNSNIIECTVQRLML